MVSDASLRFGLSRASHRSLRSGVINGWHELGPNACSPLAFSPRHWVHSDYEPFRCSIRWVRCSPKGHTSTRQFRCDVPDVYPAQKIRFRRRIWGCVYRAKRAGAELNVLIQARSEDGHKISGDSVPEGTALRLRGGFHSIRPVVLVAIRDDRTCTKEACQAHDDARE